ncbi:hypothetical protein C8R45DRAFT_971928 [Mycena sanguinolenta]|nr:hypothetical protein C8R45DRAFT_971928 [Mycena sanguinolenta]
MKIFQRLISIAALVAVSIEPLSKCVFGGKTLCTDMNFTGDCLHMDLVDDRWTSITDPGLVGQVSSIIPDHEPHDCLMAMASTTIFVSNSGISNLGSQGLDNLAVSVQRVFPYSRRPLYFSRDVDANGESV